MREAFFGFFLGDSSSDLIRLIGFRSVEVPPTTSEALPKAVPSLSYPQSTAHLSIPCALRRLRRLRAAPVRFLRPSACCAGVLCTVLWDRFFNLPALLALRDYTDAPVVPKVGVCQPVDAIVENFLNHEVKNNKDRVKLAAALIKILKHEPIEDDQLRLLQHLFNTNNLNLAQVFDNYTVECSRMIKKCRWHNILVPCEDLFKKEITPWGFFTENVGEEWVKPLSLSGGHIYFAVLLLVFEEDQNEEKLVQGSCVSKQGYSQRLCSLKHKEKKCGCSDPFRASAGDQYEDKLPPCGLKQIMCVNTRGNKGLFNDFV
ncbi:unnamed protein product [Diatraea saccharalis]|uniref:Uncharacterized protein n=1 Tax=Diatraea saccharalis TaxID=40085 RepID=A0A9N9R8J1_9NEOP|nr:unnamed protein product [Diatraea saccharalis]